MVVRGARCSRSPSCRAGSVLGLLNIVRRAEEVQPNVPEAHVRGINLTVTDIERLARNTGERESLEIGRGAPPGA